MRRTALFGAALALVMTSGAFAQTPPAPGAGEILTPPPELTPGASAPEANTAPAPGSEPTVEPGSADAMEEIDRMREGGDRRERRRARRERRDERFARGGEDAGGPRHRGGQRERERFDWRGHHRGPGPMMGGMGMRGRNGPQGAVFRFSRGEDGPSIVIRCADRDTTQECVDAVGPMLQMMLPNAQ